MERDEVISSGDNDLSVRPAAASEIAQLAQLWHAAWNDGHGAIAPQGLVRARTIERFAERLVGLLSETRVIGPAGAPLGFCALRADELYQLFVARAARGSGVAAALLADGEARLAAHGITTAWLACAVGNDRAARFYEKQGWRNARTITNRLETQDGVFEIAIWRYEKRLAPS
jgi:ribosomal protein S18 acetylase RimI-like enzyme